MKTPRLAFFAAAAALIVDDQTKFENNVQPSVGDFAEVHGLVVANGTIAASFIERKATPLSPAFEVKGFVQNHTVGSTTFQIGGLNINFAGATINEMPN